MHAKYNQYFDYNEISNQLDKIYSNNDYVSEDDKYANSKELTDQKPFLDMDLFMDNMTSEDLLAFQELLDQFGLAHFGQVT